MKRRKLFLSLIIALFGILLMACNAEVVEPGLHEIGNDEFAEILADEGETGTFVYIGRPTCQECRAFEPILQRTLQHLEMSMYYFQTAKARYDTEAGGEARMLELLAPLQIEGIPIIVYLVDGQVIDYLIGLHQQEEVEKFINSNSIE